MSYRINILNILGGYNNEFTINLHPILQLNLEINLETLEEWEENWIRNHPEETKEPKKYFDFYQDIIEYMSNFLHVSSFAHHEFESLEPLFYARWDEMIEQYWKGETEDLIIWDFEGNNHKHRYTVTFQPKTIKGMYLISLYLLYAAKQEWFMEVNSDVLFRHPEVKTIKVSNNQMEDEYNIKVKECVVEVENLSVPNHCVINMRTLGAGSLLFRSFNEKNWNEFITQLIETGRLN